MTSPQHGVTAERGAGAAARRLLLIAAGLLFGSPLAYLLVLSLQPEGSGLGAPVGPTLREPRFENWAAALRELGDVPRLLANTLTITVLSIAGQLFTCSLAGYAFARLRFRGRELLFTCVLATLMLPDQATALPRFLIFRTLGLVDTPAPLILPTVLGGAPFFVFLFRQYFLALPSELDEAARVDGCGPLRAYWSIFLPLARPMLVTVGLFTFLATWNDFWSPLIYLLSPEQRTLTLALAGFQRTYDTAVEHLMAASGLVLAPCVLLYFLAQRIALRSVAVAARKG